MSMLLLRGGVRIRHSDSWYSIRMSSIQRNFYFSTGALSKVELQRSNRLTPSSSIRRTFVLDALELITGFPSRGCLLSRGSIGIKGVDRHSFGFIFLYKVSDSFLARKLRSSPIYWLRRRHRRGGEVNSVFRVRLKRGTVAMNREKGTC